MGTLERIIEEIILSMKNLHEGRLEQAKKHLQELKILEERLPKNLQDDIQAFITQVEFHIDYDPFHLIDSDIQRVADQLIKDLKMDKT